MALYAVPLEGGGAMYVNAGSPEAALENVQAQGGSVGGSANYLAAPGTEQTTHLQSAANGYPTGGEGGGGTSTIHPDIAVATIQAGSAAARTEYDRWVENLKYSSLTAAEKEAFAMQKAQQAAENAIGQEQNRLQSVNLAQQGALGLLNQAAALRGPRNAMQFLRVMGQTPAGLQDLVRALGGAYRVPGMTGPTQGVSPEAANLSNFMQDVTNNNMQMRQLAEVDAAKSQLVNPNQIDVANWNNLGSYGQQASLGLYEDAGWDADTVTQAIEEAAPEFKTPTWGTMKF